MLIWEKIHKDNQFEIMKFWYLKVDLKFDGHMKKKNRKNIVPFLNMIAKLLIRFVKYILK